MQLWERCPVEAAEVGLHLWGGGGFLPLRLGVGSVGLGVRVAVGSVRPACAAARPALLVEEELPDLRAAIAIPFFVFSGRR